MKQFDTKKLEYKLNIISSRMRGIWNATRTPTSKRTGVLERSINLTYDRPRSSIRFQALNIYYARYQDEGTILRRRSTPEQSELWEGRGRRGRGLRRNGGIRPAFFTRPMVIEKDVITNIIKEAITEEASKQLVQMIRTRIGRR